MSDSSVHLVYLVGAPGVGKSTAVARALRDELRSAVRVDGAPFEAWRADLVAGSFYYLGNPTDPEFPGTDRLSMSVHPKALDWIASLDGPVLVFGEGDRLGSSKWLGEVADTGVAVTVIAALLDEPSRALRADERAKRTGVAQDESWAAGRSTKIENLLKDLEDRADVTVVTISFAGGRFDNAARLRRLVMSNIPEPAPGPDPTTTEQEVPE